MARDKIYSLRLLTEEYDKLNNFAADRGINKDQLIRDIINKLGETDEEIQEQIMYYEHKISTLKQRLEKKPIESKQKEAIDTDLKIVDKHVQEIFNRYNKSILAIKDPELRTSDHVKFDVVPRKIWKKVPEKYLEKVVKKVVQTISNTYFKMDIKQYNDYETEFMKYILS